MEDNLKLAWFAGLFEGEGTFAFHKNIAKALSLTSTDKDVLDKIKEYFGGSIYKEEKRDNKPHWKDVHVWRITGEPSVKLCLSILPLLCSRRRKRGLEYIDSYMNRDKARLAIQLELLSRNSEIIRLRKEGLKHREIANKLGIDRTTVTKLLNGV